jgi:hypothetical protein
MNWINTVTDQFYFGNNTPPDENWRMVSIEEFNALRASNWNPTEYIFPYRISKDTITLRVLEAGKINDLIALVNNLPIDQKFLWDNFAWFWNNNATIIAMCTQIGLDPNVILAKDPYLKD